MANMRERALYALLKRPERVCYRTNNRFQVQESLDNYRDKIAEKETKRNYWTEKYIFEILKIERT